MVVVEQQNPFNQPMNLNSALTVLAFALPASLTGGLPPGMERAARSPLATFFVEPTRVVWQSESGAQHASSLLTSHAGQAVLKEPQPPCALTAQSGSPAGILLDFGRELHGYVELITPMTKDQEKLTVAARLRRETTMTVAWIAARLSMGTRGYAHHLLYRRSQSPAE